MVQGQLQCCPGTQRGGFLCHLGNLLEGKGGIWEGLRLGWLPEYLLGEQQSLHLLPDWLHLLSSLLGDLAWLHGDLALQVDCLGVDCFSRGQCKYCSCHSYSIPCCRLGTWMGFGVATFSTPRVGFEASWWIDDAEEVAALREVRLAWPFSLAFWYCSHHDLRNWHQEKRAW